MAFWNGKQKALSPWSCAKEITKTQAQQESLPLGWYIYQDGYVWYGLKPNADRTALERSFCRSSPNELSQWLGTSVPESSHAQAAEPSKSPNLDALISQATAVPPSPCLSDTPQADTQLAQEIQELEQDIRDTESALDMPPPGLVAPSGEDIPEKKKRKRKSQGRYNAIMTRFSDAELVRFRRRVQHSGLNQSEFLRRAALTGKIVIEERDPASIAILDELELIRAELGRQGGMLKMVIKPNEGQRELTPEEWTELIQAIRYLENTKKRLAQLEAKL